MATKTIKTQIGLRRDTEANYALVKDTLIPVKGEVCMVDTAKGLKFKIGDGISTFAQLDFITPTTSDAGGTSVEANPELIGDEEKLNSINIDGTNYDIPGGAEAYVEENQTLVINNNGTGTIGYKGPNIVEINEVTIPSDMSNSSSSAYVTKERLEEIMNADYVKLSNDGGYILMPKWGVFHSHVSFSLCVVESSYERSYLLNTISIRDEEGNNIYYLTFSQTVFQRTTTN